MDVGSGVVVCPLQHSRSEEAPGAASADISLCAVVLGVMLAPWFAWEWSTSKAIEFTPTIVGAIFYLGVGPSLLAYLCWNQSVAIIGPTRAAFVYYCLPLFSGVEAILLLGEPVGVVHILSGILICVLRESVFLESHAALSTSQ